MQKAEELWKSLYSSLLFRTMAEDPDRCKLRLWPEILRSIEGLQVYVPLRVRAFIS